MVCSGKLDLSTAQRDIATDWIAACKKYFHTDRPLSLRSALIEYRIRGFLGPPMSATPIREAQITKHGPFQISVVNRDYH